MNRTASVLVACALALAEFSQPGDSCAGELVYKPINPSFGGNPFNSGHLLGIAGAQNKYEDSSRSPRSALGGGDPAEAFVRQLQSRLLSSLAAQVTEAIFGENPQESGEVRFGEVSVTFARGLDSIDLTIFNFDTGAETKISVPMLNVQ